MQSNLVKIVPPVLAALKEMESSFGPAYKEVEDRIGEFGDLEKFDLRYSDPENPVRKNFHESIYLEFLQQLQHQLTSAGALSWRIFHD